MKRKFYLRNKRGFTLIEVMITLIIIAILVAALVPALSGYVEKSKERELITECKGIYTVAQAALDEYYSFNNEAVTDRIKTQNIKLYTSSGSLYNTLGGANATGVCGRITNWTFSRLQCNWDLEKVDHVDGYIGQRVMEYLESEYHDKTLEPDHVPRYKFSWNGRDKRFGNIKDKDNSGYNTAAGYLKNTGHQAAINLYYNKYGCVFLVEYARDGYLVTLEDSGIGIEYDGRPCIS